MKLTLLAENMSVKEVVNISGSLSDIDEQIMTQKDPGKDEHGNISKSDNSSYNKGENMPGKHKRRRRKKKSIKCKINLDVSNEIHNSEYLKENYCNTQQLTQEKSPPVFAYDGLINKDDVITVWENNSSYNILQSVKQCASDNRGLNRDFWLSMGNTECVLVTNQKFKDLEFEFQCSKITEEVMISIFDNVNTFSKEVLSKGGRVFLSEKLCDVIHNTTILGSQKKLRRVCDC